MAVHKTAGEPGSVAFVGAIPGNPELLTTRGEHLLAQADVVLAPAELAGVVAAVRPASPVAEPPSPGQAAPALAACRAGRHVVRLVVGDPMSDADATAELAAHLRAGVAVEVVPSPALELAVAGYAGIPTAAPLLLGAPGGGQGRVGDAQLSLLSCAVDSLAGEVAKLLAAGWRPQTPAAVTSGGGGTSQRTEVGTLATCVEQVASAGLEGPVVLAVGDAVRRRPALSWFESRPLFGWRVLVPRTRAQSGELSGLLRGFGADPLEVPTIAVEPPRTPAPMERAIKGLVTGRYAWVAFTSTNAVRAVRERLEEVGLDARAFAGVRLAVIGDATAAALAEFGLRADLAPTRVQSSEGLLAEWPDHDEVFDVLDRVFLPRADIATETLVAGLKERGWAVDDVTAYRTVRAAPPPAPIREAIKTGGLDAVTFTSSSTVRNLVGIAGKPHPSTVVACIGPQTQATAQELGLRVDVVPREASIPALARALAEFAATRAAEAATGAGATGAPGQRSEAGRRVMARPGAR